jgi:hypothetical protein
LHRTDFVVRQHHAREDSLRTQCRLEFLEQHVPVWSAAQVGDFESKFLERLRRVQARMVLDRRRDDVVPCTRPPHRIGNPQHRRIDALRAPAREKDLRRTRAKARRHRLSGVVHRALSIAASLVQPARISEPAVQERQHCLPRQRVQRSGRGMVQVDHPRQA